MRFDVTGLADLPEIDEESDLPGMIVDGIDALASDADLVCVASTVVAKHEGRVRELSSYEPGPEARELARVDADLTPRFAEASDRRRHVLRETEELLLAEPFLLSVTRIGHVAPNAGIDRSNVAGDECIVLLPEDPQASARRLSDAIDRPVIVTDTCGRPFRCGQTGVAVGWHGLAPIRDWRGEADRHGHELEATEEAVADELAGAANVAMGEAGGGVPAAAISGAQSIIADCKGETLFRPDEDDVVRAALRVWSGD